MLHAVVHSWMASEYKEIAVDTTFVKEFTDSYIPHIITQFVKMLKFHPHKRYVTENFFVCYTNFVSFAIVSMFHW